MVLLELLTSFGKNKYKEGKDALKSLEHRGPDAQGSWSDGHHIYLGHNRLSIIDISNKANQPFLSSKEDALIVFNGEIYNYKELRKQLSFDSFHYKFRYRDNSRGLFRKRR